jgi:hypothetical protein
VEVVLDGGHAPQPEAVGRLDDVQGGGQRLLIGGDVATVRPQPPTLVLVLGSQDGIEL